MSNVDVFSKLNRLGAFEFKNIVKQALYEKHIKMITYKTVCPILFLLCHSFSCLRTVVRNTSAYAT